MPLPSVAVYVAVALFWRVAGAAPVGTRAVQLTVTAAFCGRRKLLTRDVAGAGGAFAGGGAGGAAREGDGEGAVQGEAAGEGVGQGDVACGALGVADGDGVGGGAARPTLGVVVLLATVRSGGIRCRCVCRARCWRAGWG